MPSHTDHMSKRPLTGIRVIALGQIAASSFARSRLAYLGANSEKIERPDGVGGMPQ